MYFNHIHDAILHYIYFYMYTFYHVTFNNETRYACQNEINEINEINVIYSFLFTFYS